MVSIALSNAGALITLGLGLLGLLAPARAAAFVSVQPIGRIGTSEIRATYGGLFTALGALCLLRQDPAIFLVAGLAWAGIASGRLLSVLVDASRSSKNLAAILFELGIGLLLLAPALSQAGGGPR
jgi:hypothetical protein